MELVYTPQAGTFNFGVFSVDRAHLPGINVTLRKLHVSINMLSDLFMQFVAQHLCGLTHIVLIRETQNYRAMNNILSRATAVNNITHLEIRNHSRLDQILPGVMNAFLQISNLTLTRRGITVNVPLNLAGLDLTMLRIDRNILPRAQVVLLVQSVTRSRIYVREADGARFAEVDRLPVVVFTVRVFVNGLQHLHLFDSKNRNYQQFFNIDQ